MNSACFLSDLTLGIIKYKESGLLHKLDLHVNPNPPSLSTLLLLYNNKDYVLPKKKKKKNDTINQGISGR